jgi:hypothetical protein
MGNGLTRTGPRVSALLLWSVIPTVLHNFVHNFVDIASDSIGSNGMFRFKRHLAKVFFLCLRQKGSNNIVIEGGKEIPK